MGKKSNSMGLIARQDEKWRAEGDLHTCLEYAKIKKDKKRMAAVKKIAKEKVAELKEKIVDTEAMKADDK